MEKDNLRNKKLIAIAKFILLLLFIIGIPAYLFIFQYDLIMSFHSLDEVRDFLLRYELVSILVYVAFPIFHVVIAVIPGPPFHIASGFVFGFWLGYVLTMTGILIGSTITFYLSRKLGKDAMYLFFGEEKFTKFINLVNSKKGLIAIFLIYLIPGVPLKEGLGYVVGLSKIKLLPFLLLVLIGRTPAVMVSILIGTMYDHESYTGIIILASIVMILFALAAVYYKKVMKRINAWFDKLSTEE
ncbi:MAG: VTT domain-containing protein [Clostridiales bacterium]|nr:VTT domain-containing protein [Clostridiales bacterium]